MNRTALRRRLRRRMNDVEGDTWSDSDMNEVLNDAIHDMQQDILAVNKNAIVNTWRANLVADQSEYSLPSGMLWDTAVRILDSPSGEYLRIDRWSKKDVEAVALGQITLTSDAGYVYAIEGQNLYLGPAPSANLSDGLEVSGVPTLDMADDSDVPDLPISMHMVIVYRAELLLKPEGNDDTKQAEAAVARWKEMLPAFYRASASPSAFQVDGLRKDW